MNDLKWHNLSIQTHWRVNIGDFKQSYGLIDNNKTNKFRVYLKIICIASVNKMLRCWASLTRSSFYFFLSLTLFIECMQYAFFYAICPIRCGVMYLCTCVKIAIQFFFLHHFNIFVFVSWMKIHKSIKRFEIISVKIVHTLSVHWVRENKIRLYLKILICRLSICNC